MVRLALFLIQIKATPVKAGRLQGGPDQGAGGVPSRITPGKILSMRHEIFRITDPAGFIVVATGEPVPYLTYDGKVYGEAKVVSTGGTDATLEELVDLCDHDAEDRNAHDFCSIHRLLGAVLYRRFGRESATAAMLDIALLGGLQGMGGICSKGDAFTELGVGKAGHDWNGNYGE